MRKIIICIGILLSGCASQAQIDAADDSQCASYGAHRGDQAYVQCRTHLATSRNQVNATMRAAVIDMPAPAVDYSLHIAEPLPPMWGR